MLKSKLINSLCVSDIIIQIFILFEKVPIAINQTKHVLIDHITAP